MTLKNTQFKNLDIFSAFLLMILSACLITSPSLFAQDADESAESTEEQQTEASDDEVELSKISVTGSRIKRSEIEGPQPLVVLTEKTLSKVDLYQFMKLLRQSHRILVISRAPLLQEDLLRVLKQLTSGTLVQVIYLF